MKELEQRQKEGHSHVEIIIDSLCLERCASSIIKMRNLEASIFNEGENLWFSTKYSELVAAHNEREKRIDFSVVIGNVSKSMLNRV